MPFEQLGADEHPDWWTDDGKTVPEVLLRQINRKRFQLQGSFRYRTPAGQCWDVAAHDLKLSGNNNNSTDLASAPQLLWWFFASYGVHTRAALLHDQFADGPDPEGNGPSRATRHRADRVFELALAESGVRWLRRKLIWTAVSLRTSWGTVGFGIIVVHLLALSVAMAYWAFGDKSWWPRDWFPSGTYEWIPVSPRWLPAVLLALAGFLWGIASPPLSAANAPTLGMSRVSAIFWGTARWPLAVLAFGIVAPPSILAVVARCVYLLADLIEEISALFGRLLTVATGQRVKLADLDRKFALPRVQIDPNEGGQF